MPIASWLRGPLAPWLRETLSPQRVADAGLLDPQWTQQLVADHLAGRVNHRKELWAALMLSVWAEGPYGPRGGRGS